MGESAAVAVVVVVKVVLIVVVAVVVISSSSNSSSSSSDRSLYKKHLHLLTKTSVSHGYGVFVVSYHRWFGSFSPISFAMASQSFGVVKLPGGGWGGGVGEPLSRRAGILVFSRFSLQEFAASDSRGVLQPS